MAIKINSRETELASKKGCSKLESIHSINRID